MITLVLVGLALAVSAGAWLAIKVDDANETIRRMHDE